MEKYTESYDVERLLGNDIEYKKEYYSEELEKKGRPQMLVDARAFQQELECNVFGI